ncbi:MAG TPA: hypothetical protein QGF05_00105 [Dehalococcoidia bacterium]|nr:hypothetical protein [Dehalococcoidia bacterium]
MANPMRFLALLVLGAFLASGVANAQAPPSPPHTFFGQSTTLDGSPVDNGTVISALDADGAVVGTGIVDAGTWLIQVDPDVASVSITIGDAAPAGPFDVESGALTEVTLNLTSGTPPPPDDGGGDPGPGPDTLPNGGTGGLGDVSGGFALLPILAALAIAAMAGLGVREWSTRR